MTTLTNKEVGAPPDNCPKGPDTNLTTTTIATATAANAKDTAHRRQDGYAAPTIEDRREHDLFAELKSLGYGITVPCLICSRPLTSKRSLATHVGPVCRARLTEVVSHD